jgi:hypothetical protein
VAESKRFLHTFFAGHYRKTDPHSYRRLALLLGPNELGANSDRWVKQAVQVINSIFKGRYPDSCLGRRIVAGGRGIIRWTGSVPAYWLASFLEGNANVARWGAPVGYDRFVQVYQRILLGLDRVYC